MSNLSLSDLIRMTRRHCEGSSRTPVNRLVEEKNLASPTAVLEFSINGVQVGQSVEIDWVEYDVVDATIATKTLTLLETVQGTAVTHPAGSRVAMRQRFPTRDIIDALNADLDDLETQGIYKLRTVAATGGVMTSPVDALVILDAWDDNAGDTELHHWPPNLWRIGDDPAGARLVGPSGVGFMVFGCSLGEFPYDEDVDVSSTGLFNTAEDLPPLGAAITLLAGREAQRNLSDTQGETRRASEVPSGGMTGALRNLAALRQNRVASEARRLQQRYGLRLHGRV